MNTKGGWNGLSIQVANKLFESLNIRFEDHKLDEGSYVAYHPDSERQIRKGRSTECVKAVIESWFVLKQ